ncbi:hypothetical protein RUM43_010040 [Polyplax serrata]|uniref:Uncharacterized protein n=1 Tax=Polyplax serrata TaxID=468196 RepID=A0AAN8P8A0_POLSC
MVVFKVRPTLVFRQDIQLETESRPEGLLMRSLATRWGVQVAEYQEETRSCVFFASQKPRHSAVSTQKAEKKSQKNDAPSQWVHFVVPDEHRCFELK